MAQPTIIRAFSAEGFALQCYSLCSSVFGCSFDMVDHNILFLDRGLPLVILRFLVSWYGSQECCVRWGVSFSNSFNGVRQGSTLPFCGVFG